MRWHAYRISFLFCAAPRCATVRTTRRRPTHKCAWKLHARRSSPASPTRTAASSAARQNQAVCHGARHGCAQVVIVGTCMTGVSVTVWNSTGAELTCTKLGNTATRVRVTCPDGVWSVGRGRRARSCTCRLLTHGPTVGLCRRIKQHRNVVSPAARPSAFRTRRAGRTHAPRCASQAGAVSGRELRCGAVPFLAAELQRQRALTGQHGQHAHTRTRAPALSPSSR
jgi:hypothetical protein